MQWVLAGYTFSVATASGFAEGLLIVLLSVLCFIFKKTMLAFTDKIALDSAMLMAGAPPFLVEPLFVFGGELCKRSPLVLINSVGSSLYLCSP